MYRVGRNDKNSIRKIQIVPKMLAQIGIPLGVVHRSGRSHNPERRGGTFSGAVAGADLRPEQDNSTGSASKQKNIAT